MGLENEILKREFGNRFRYVNRIAETATNRIWIVQDGNVGWNKRVLKFSVNDVNTEMIKECKELVNLDHPNVIRIFDVLNDRYLLMEYANEGNLRTKINDYKSLRKKFTENEAVDIILQAAQGTHAIHEAIGMAHCDIKPENLLIKDGIIKVADLGIAREIDASTKGTFGSAGYCMREQMLTKKGQELFKGGVTVRRSTDNGSLGIVLFELLANANPYDGLGEDESRLIRETDKFIEDKVKSLSASDKLKKIILNAVKAVHEDRVYKVTTHLIADLEEAYFNPTDAVNSLYQGICRFINGRLVYDVVTPGSVEQIIGSRKEMEEAIKAYLPNDKKVNAIRKKADERIIKIRTRDYRKFFELATKYKHGTSEFHNHMDSNDAQRKLFLELLNEEHWDLSTRRHKQKWRREYLAAGSPPDRDDLIKPEETDRLYEDGEHFIQFKIIDGKKWEPK